MGASAQKRLVRRLDLERVLLQVDPHPSPKAILEQYTVPVDVASEMLFLAAYVHDDVTGKTVADLGCGTGRLIVGAALLDAEKGVGIDIDRLAIRKAKQSAKSLNLDRRLSWIIGDINTLRGEFDTVLQNPPFGVQRRAADRRFILKALELAPIIYSIQKATEHSSKGLLRRMEERLRAYFK